MSPSAAGTRREEEPPVGDVAIPGADDPVADLQAALDRHFEEWCEKLDRQVTQRIRSALAGARDAHAALMETAGLRREDPEAELDWDALRVYRQGVRAEVFRPLVSLFDEVDPGRRIGQLFEAFLSGFEDVVAGAPETLRRPAPPDRYRRSEDDGPGRAALKGVLRAGQSLADTVRRTPPVQTVPLRRVVTAALEVEGLSGLPGILDDLYQIHARPLLVAELALGRWVRDWFPLEAADHTVEDHLDPDEYARLATLRERLRSASIEATRQAASADGPAEEPVADDPSEAPPAAEAQHAEEDPDAGEDAESDPRIVAAGLHEALAEAAEAVPTAQALDAVAERVTLLKKRLADRIREAGTRLTLHPRPRDNRRRASQRKRLDARRKLWAAWFESSAGRFRLGDDFLALRQDVEELLDGLLGSTLRDSVFFLAERVEAAQEGLQELLARTLEMAGEDGADARALATATESIETDTRAVLDETLLEPVVERDPRSRVEQAGSETAQRLRERMLQLPESLEVHPVRPTPESVDPTQATRSIPLRDVALQSLDLLHMEALRASTKPLLEYLGQVEAECRELADMVAFNLNSALEALEDEAESEEEDPDAPLTPEDSEEEAAPEPRETAVEAAHALSREGLERAATGLEVILAPAVTAWDAFSIDAHELLLEGRRQIHERLVVEGTMQEQIRDVRTLVRMWWRKTLDRARSWWRATWPRIRRFWMRLYIKVLRLVRRGRSAMEGVDTRKHELAADVLRGIPALLEPLPLIYRRLYSFQPLTDPTLLVGRGDDLAWVGHLYGTWLEGASPPAVLAGTVTVGHTSVLNALEEDLFADEEVVRIAFATRYETEDALAARLARALWEDEAGPDERPRRRAGSKPEADDDGEEDGEPWSFARLEERLREGEERHIVLLERLEHTLLRVPGGLDLAERFLAFQSRTAGSVFWVNTISHPAWKLLATTRPRAAALASVRTLAPLDRKAVEELLIARHRRSGVPLEFMDPDDPNPLLKRKLQRSRSEKDRQAALRADFFDRLFKASQGSIPMAILLWLKAADFTSRPGWLRLQEPKGIRFEFLEQIDLTLSFTLMALLEHESLTLDEFARVFAVPADEAFQTFEALRRKVLIERLDSPGGGLPAPVKRLEPGVRYRVPPIITQVVAQGLRDQNILH
ncbi:MAG TPA: hypothetical protein VK858_15585 [Longimicrobiales bacterium]|nr:hypothetical protein [Longimicrobiales bacterium]